MTPNIIKRQYKNLAIIFTLFLSMLFFTNNNVYSQSNAKPRVKVITQAVQFTPNDRVFEALGTGKAQSSADIHPAISEEVMEVLFKSQQHVKRGDILVQLDDRQEKLAVQLAEVKLKNTKSLYNRYKKAVKSSAVPQSEVDEAKANYEAAQVELDQAVLSLEERKIVAPFDGIVGIPTINPGDRVTPETKITGLDNRDVLYVDFEVPEFLAGALREAQANKQEITATTPSYPDRVFFGIITAQESRFNASTRTLMARASIMNEEDVLKPGMSFKTRWETPGKLYATTPEISLQWGHEGSYVWIIREGVAKQVMAKVVARKAGQILLDGNISEGEKVVVEGVQRLRPDTRVEMINKVRQDE